MVLSVELGGQDNHLLEKKEGACILDSLLLINLAVSGSCSSPHQRAVSYLDVFEQLP